MTVAELLLVEVQVVLHLVLRVEAGPEADEALAELGVVDPGGSDGNVRLGGVSSCIVIITIIIIIIIDVVVVVIMIVIIIIIVIVVLIIIVIIIINILILIIIIIIITIIFIMLMLELSPWLLPP